MEGHRFFGVETLWPLDTGRNIPGEVTLMLLGYEAEPGIVEWLPEDESITGESWPYDLYANGVNMGTRQV